MSRNNNPYSLHLEKKPLLLQFEGDGSTPNNHLPVIVYPQVIKNSQIPYNDCLEKIFQANGWTNNWRDIILMKDHYHSTTHEVLGISKGVVRLHLGGKNGKPLLAKAGDVIIIPAGVGHYSLSNQAPYEVVGGYPNGLEWDVIFAAPNKYEAAKEKIAQLAIPNKDPIGGINGYLKQVWRENNEE